MKSYLTVGKTGTSEIVIEKSKFIAYCKAVQEQKEAEEFIAFIKKKNYDATHNVFAYRLLKSPLVEKSSDDGEPSGTAGMPILNFLRQKDLYNVCIVVTRYFGGIKLGKGGLVRAYGQAVVSGVLSAGIIMKQVYRTVTFFMDYTLFGKIKNEAEKRELKVKDIHFAENVAMELYLEEKDLKKVCDDFFDISEGRLSITQGEEVYLDCLIPEERYLEL